MNDELKPAQWIFSNIWNDSLLTFDNRIIEPRNYIYASEICSPYVDRYLKMKGTKQSNPPNDRSLRKFQSGNIWEWIVGFVLKRAGILQERQAKLRHQLPDMLMVSGKLDYVAGGQPDWDRADYEIKQLDLPDFLYYASMQIIGRLKAKYGNTPLEECVLEVKSVGSYGYEFIEKSGVPRPNHYAQNWYYCLTYNKPGKLVYVCREDCQLLEFRVEREAADAMDIYRKDVEEMTYYYNKKKQPPLEKELVFEEGIFKFNKNWKVEWSPYLTLLYGYKTPQEYREKHARVTAS